MALSECSFDNESGGGGESVTNQLNSIHEAGNTATHYAIGNYGTLASQRPVRARKRPQRLCDEVPHPFTKKQKRAQRNPTTRKLSDNTKRTHQTPVQSQNGTIFSDPAGCSDYSSEFQEKKSKVVILKVPLDTSLLETSQRSSTDQHMDEEYLSALSSPISSLHSNSVGSLHRI